MSKFFAYIRQLVGNGSAATIGIFIFIIILALLFWRPAHSAEVDMAGGSSFGTEGYGPTLSLDLRQPLFTNPGLDVFAGTDLWGSTKFDAKIVPNNWDWHAGIEGCKWRICAGIGPAFVQRVDAINGAHTNFYLGLRFAVTPRFSVVLGHLSDAGTSSPNVGRQFLSLAYRF